MSDTRRSSLLRHPRQCGRHEFVAQRCRVLESERKRKKQKIPPHVACLAYLPARRLCLPCRAPERPARFEGSLALSRSRSGFGRRVSGEDARYSNTGNWNRHRPRRPQRRDVCVRICVGGEGAGWRMGTHARPGRSWRPASIPRALAGWRAGRLAGGGCHMGAGEASPARGWFVEGRVGWPRGWATKRPSFWLVRGWRLVGVGG